MRKLLFIVTAILMAACSPKVLPITNTQKDSVFIRTTDSLVVRDSIYIDRYKFVREKDDTVYVTETRLEFRDRWRDREVHDTTIVERIVQEEKVVVERQLTAWQRFQKNGFWVLLAALVLAITIKILRRSK